MDLSDAAAQRRLATILQAHAATFCPTCGRHLDCGDLAWTRGQTEAGTAFSTVEIVCQACDTSIAHVSSWYPAETLEEVLDLLEDEWQ